MSIKNMKASIATTIKTAATYLVATLQAIAILTLAPESYRSAKIAQAKANIAKRRATIEQELTELKETINPPVTSTPAPTALPALPDPWTLELHPTSQPTTANYHWTIAPPLPLLPPAKATPTIRELKAIASTRKIKGYSNMTKAQLLKALS